MNYRKLRIARSVARGIICLMLIVLWARSYWPVDGLRISSPPTSYRSLSSENGGIQISDIEPPATISFEFYSTRSDGCAVVAQRVG
jgi:hypothetical protein